MNDYYKQANQWGDDQYLAVLKSGRRWFIIAVFALLIALASVVALAGFAPLKEIKPHVVEVNNATGQVREITQTELANYTANEAVAEHFLAKYLRECEGFDHRFKDDWFRNCQLFSGQQRASEYITFIKTDPRSPLRTLKKPADTTPGETREVFIQSIVHLNPTAVHVRFQSKDKLQGRPDEIKHWAAVIDFAWGKPVTDSEEQRYRYLNPLGFHVTKYRKDQELVKGRQGA